MVRPNKSSNGPKSKPPLSEPAEGIVSSIPEAMASLPLEVSQPQSKEFKKKKSNVLFPVIMLFLSSFGAFGAFLWQLALTDPTKQPESASKSLSFCPRSPTDNLSDRWIDMKSFSINGENEETPLECFFSSNFYEAQALFKKSASKVPNAQLYRLPTIQGDDSLCADIAYIPGHSKKFLIHISGTHGPEGFAGSAAQSAALQYMANSGNYIQAEESPTIIFVHALNPYGFANNRRVNEENIDLNRNFLFEEQFAEVKARDPNFAGYLDIDDVINPTSKPFKDPVLNEIWSYGILAKAIAFHGLAKIKKALVSGNYFKSTGLGFGGFKLSRSAVNLRGLINHFEINKHAEKVVLIDVHTGLGPSGVDTLMIDLTEYSEDEKIRLRNLFPEDINSTTNSTIGGIFENFKGENDTASASSGYELTVGTVTEDFCRKWLAPNLRIHSKLCITQEFGTLPTYVVGKCLADENYAFHYGTPEEKEIAGRKLKGAFYIETDAWKRNVARRGLALILQGIDAFNTLE